ncbi:hypothetical protein [Mycolicibacterium hodleri]|nr:hypothetical protein [Mycolicibacterium hodleri]
MTALDGVLDVCAADVQVEMKQLMFELDPAVDLTTVEAVAILAILRGADARRGHQPPQTPKPQPHPGRRLQAV